MARTASAAVAGAGPVSCPLREEFRRAMRRHAATVAVVTTRHGGRRLGLTATAVVPVSMEPPMLLVSIRGGASLSRPLRAAGRFCVNLLDATQADIAAECSGGLPEVRLARAEWLDGPDGLPCLVGAQASLFCRLARRVSVATHALFIGGVVEVRVAGTVSPLLYLDGAYATVVRSISGEPASRTAPPPAACRTRHRLPPAGSAFLRRGPAAAYQKGNPSR